MAVDPAPHRVRDTLIERLGLVPGQLRVIAPDVGGGFGGKIVTDVDVTVLCWTVRRLGRPVRWTETRNECMLAMNHGRAQRQRVTIGGRRDGTLLAYRLEILADAGAYPHGAWLPGVTVWMAGGAYAIPHVDGRARSVVTNTTPINAYRGAGRPEATAAIERAVDMFAAEVGMDPADVRRRNLLRPEAFPYTHAHAAWSTTPATIRRRWNRSWPRRTTPRCGPSRPAAGRPETACSTASGWRRYVEVTGFGNEEHGRVVIDADGSVTVDVGTAAQGQGHATTYSMIIADQLGVPLDRITVRHADTGTLGHGTGTFASRSVQTGGSALHEATERLHDEALPFAAAALGRGRERCRPRPRHRALAGRRRPGPTGHLGRVGQPGPAGRVNRR